MAETQYPYAIAVSPEDSGKRLDQFLAGQMSDTSRVRIQQLIAEGKVLMNGTAVKPSVRVRGGEQISIVGEVDLAPLKAMAEDIPLDIVYEDEALAIINKPAGMMVHAGAGASEDERNRGTLVNALLHHFKQLSGVGGSMRPGIVHRLDKATSGLIVVAKSDNVHRKLAAQFAGREVKKTYIALVHGRTKNEKGTINSSISRDRVRRTRMTTRREGGREAISHYAVKERMETKFGKFTMLEVRIDTGRTHQIRVHLSSLGHPVVGDRLYGAPGEIRAKDLPPVSLERNFLHAAELRFRHPETGEPIEAKSDLPGELREFAARLRL